MSLNKKQVKVYNVFTGNFSASLFSACLECESLIEEEDQVWESTDTCHMLSIETYRQYMYRYVNRYIFETYTAGTATRQTLLVVGNCCQRGSDQWTKLTDIVATTISISLISLRVYGIVTSMVINDQHPRLTVDFLMMCSD